MPVCCVLRSVMSHDGMRQKSFSHNFTTRINHISSHREMKHKYGEWLDGACCPCVLVEGHSCLLVALIHKWYILDAFVRLVVPSKVTITTWWSFVCCTVIRIGAGANYLYMLKNFLHKEYISAYYCLRCFILDTYIFDDLGYIKLMKIELSL